MKSSSEKKRSQIDEEERMVTDTDEYIGQDW